MQLDRVELRSPVSPSSYNKFTYYESSISSSSGWDVAAVLAMPCLA